MNSAGEEPALIETVAVPEKVAVLGASGVPVLSGHEVARGLRREVVGASRALREVPG